MKKDDIRQFAKQFLSLIKSVAMLVIDDSYIRASGYDEQQLRLEIAIMLFEKEKLSLRKAATLSGLHWIDFMKELDKRKIALHYDESLL
jgi:predicted HTH domain antitoxin